jgi:hypothetical protein
VYGVSCDVSGWRTARSWGGWLVPAGTRRSGPIRCSNRRRVKQLLKIGKQPVAFQLGARYYAEKPAGGSHWGLRFAMTLLFPKYLICEKEG